MSFEAQKTSILMKSRVSTFFTDDIWYCINSHLILYLRNHCPIWSHEDLFLYFKSFVLYFQLPQLGWIHYAFFCVQCVYGIQFHSFSCGCPLVLAPFIEDYSFATEFLGTLVKKSSVTMNFQDRSFSKLFYFGSF